SCRAGWKNRSEQGERTIAGEAFYLPLNGPPEIFAVLARAFSGMRIERARKKFGISMAYLNENYLKLQAGYLFPEIARRVREFRAANPKAAERLISCGIGDVTEPLPRAAVE